MQSIQWRNHLIEFFIVLLGVTLAFWLNNLSEDVKERKVEKEYLTALQADLAKDVSLLSSNIEQAEKKVRKFEGVLNKMIAGERLPLDTILKYVQLIGNYWFFTPANYTYQTLEQSGDLKIISNRTIRGQLIELEHTYGLIDELQVNFLKALDEAYFPEVYKHMDLLEGTATNEEFFRSPFIKNYFVYTYQDTKAQLEAYKSTLKMADSLQVSFQSLR